LPPEWIEALLDSKPPHAARSWLMTLRSLCQFSIKNSAFRTRHVLQLLTAGFGTNLTSRSPLDMSVHWGEAVHAPFLPLGVAFRETLSHEGGIK
jgi:hypothetical protein